MDITKADVNNILAYAIAGAGGSIVLFILCALFKASFWNDNEYTRQDARIWLVFIILCIVGGLGFAWYISLPNTRSLQ